MGYRAFKTGLAMGASGNPFIGAMQTGVAMEQYRAQKRDTEWQKMSGNVARLETDYRKLLDKNPGMTSAQAWAHPSIAPKAARLMSHRYIQQQLLEGRDDLDPRKGVELRGSQDSAQGILVGYRKDTGEEVPLTRGKSAAPGDPILQFTAQQGIEFIKEEVANATGAPTSKNVTDVYEATARAQGSGDLSYAASNNPANTAAAPQSMGTLPAPPGIPEEVQPAPVTEAAPSFPEQAAVQQQQADEARAEVERGEYTGRGGPPVIPQEMLTEERQRRGFPAEGETRMTRRGRRRVTARTTKPDEPTTVEGNTESQENFMRAFNQAETPEEKMQIQIQAEKADQKFREQQGEKVEAVSTKMAEVKSTEPDKILEKMSADDMDVITKDVGKRPDFYSGTIRGRAALAATARHLGLMGGDSVQAMQAAQNFIRYGSIAKPLTALEVQAARIKLVGDQLELREKIHDYQIKLREGGVVDTAALREDAMPTMEGLSRITDPEMEEEARLASAQRAFGISVNHSLAIDAGMKKAQIGQNLGREGMALKQEQVKYSLSLAYDKFLQDNPDEIDITQYTFADFMSALGDVDKWWRFWGPSESKGKAALSRLGLSQRDLKRLSAAYRNVSGAEAAYDAADPVMQALDEEYLEQQRAQ